MYVHPAFLTLAALFAAIIMQISPCGTNEGLIYSVLLFSVTAILFTQVKQADPHLLAYKSSSF